MSDQEINNICTRPYQSCYLCGNRGKQWYTNMSDQVWGAPGTWSFLHCSGCGLMWLHPRPIPENTWKLYVNYMTHAKKGICVQKSVSIRQIIQRAVLAGVFGYVHILENEKQKWLGKLFGLIFPIKEMVGMRIRYLSEAHRGRLLDVGCGNGQYLAYMRDLGWEVYGVDTDDEAALIAQHHYKVSVFTGNLEDANFPGDYFDAITLNHVIEHVIDPIKILRECYRILKPGGYLVVVTPNAKSIGHYIFRDAWRGFDIPRHMYLFDKKALNTCVKHAGFQVRQLRTSGRMARTIYSHSWIVRRRGSLDPNETFAWPLKIASLIYWGVEQASCIVCKDVGEEILLIAEKYGTEL